MRILHVIQRYWPARGGAELHMQRICEGLARDGHEVMVATTDVAEIAGFTRAPYRALTPDREIHNGVRIARFPMRHAAGSPLSIRAVRRLMAELSRRGWGSVILLRRLAAVGQSAPALNGWLSEQVGQFDLVAAMGIGFEWLYWPAQEFARREQIPFLLHPLIHLGDGPEDRAKGGKPRLKDYYTMRHQLALVCASEMVFAQTSVEAEFVQQAGVDIARICVAGIGIELDEATGGDAERARRALKTAVPLVLALGTQSSDKGTLCLLSAMRSLWAEGCDAELVLAGVTLPEVDAAFQKLPVPEQARVHRPGAVDDAMKRDLLAACDVFALPSRSESFGIVVLEAWANAKAVVGARAGALAAVITDEQDGLLTPYGDAGMLANSIRRLLNDVALRARLGSAGRAKLIEQYRWERVYPIIRDTYERFNPTQR